MDSTPVAGKFNESEVELNKSFHKSDHLYVVAGPSRSILSFSKSNPRSQSVMDDILGDNTIEDTSWLCSLSESELDMLISLKMLVLQRAKIIGHEKLANRFDLKMLRALGLILMEYVKQQTTDASLIPSMANPAALLENCNLLKIDLQEIMGLDEIMTCIATDSKKRRGKRKREDDDTSL